MSANIQVDKERSYEKDDNAPSSRIAHWRSIGRQCAFPEKLPSPKEMT